MKVGHPAHFTRNYGQSLNWWRGALVAFVNKIRRSGSAAYFSAARPDVRRALVNAGLKPPLVVYAAKASDVRAPEIAST